MPTFSWAPATVAASGALAAPLRFMEPALRGRRP